jgi:predicted ABC-type ATPase
MSTNDKRLYIVGGPNGAGKITIAMGILSRTLECYEYVNADSIATALSPFMPESVSMESVPKAVADALQKHKRNGQSIVVWRDGRIVEIPPELIGMYQKPLEK